MNKTILFLAVSVLLSGCANNNPVTKAKDGDYLFLLSGNDVALVHIIKQELNPETISYEYAVSNNGIESLFLNNNLVDMTTVQSVKKIQAGKFTIGWSVERSGGSGWLYFDRFPGGVVAPSEFKWALIEKGLKSKLRPDFLSILETEKNK